MNNNSLDPNNLPSIRALVNGPVRQPVKRKILRRDRSKYMPHVGTKQQFKINND